MLDLLILMHMCTSVSFCAARLVPAPLSAIASQRRQDEAALELFHLLNLRYVQICLRTTELMYTHSFWEEMTTDTANSLVLIETHNSVPTQK